MADLLPALQGHSSLALQRTTRHTFRSLLPPLLSIFPAFRTPGAPCFALFRASNGRLVAVERTGLFQVCHLNEARGDRLQVLPLQPDSLLFAALTYFALFPASNGPLRTGLCFQVFVKFRFLGRGGNRDCSLVPLLA